MKNQTNVEIKIYRRREVEPVGDLLGLISSWQEDSCFYGESFLVKKNDQNEIVKHGRWYDSMENPGNKLNWQNQFMLQLAIDLKKILKAKKPDMSFDIWQNPEDLWLLIPLEHLDYHINEFQQAFSEIHFITNNQLLKRLLDKKLGLF